MNKQIKEEIRKLPVNAHGTKVVNGKLQKKDWVSDNYINLIIRLITQAVEEREREIKKIIDKECKSNKDYLEKNNRPGTHYYNGFLHGSSWLHGLKNKLNKLTK